MEPSRAVFSERPATAGLTPLDQQIIEQLLADGRRPFTRIAADLGVSEAAVRARTNRLIERGVLRIVGLTDPRMVGLGQQATLGVRCGPDKVLEVARKVAGHPNVLSVAVTAGRYDLLVEAACRDNEALLGLVEELRHIPGVRDSETFVYLRVVKASYRPHDG